MSNPWQKYKEDQRKALDSSPEAVSLSPNAYQILLEISKIDTEPGNLPPIEDETIKNAILIQPRNHSDVE